MGTTPGLEVDSTALARAVPVRATGVELIGEVPGSGYKQPPALARRNDGQVVQLTQLLWLVLDGIDGASDYDQIASRVTTAYGRALSPDQVHELVEKQLRPLGLVKTAEGGDPVVKKANPLLAVRFKKVVTDPAITRRLTAPFTPLFRPWVFIPVTLAFIAIATWVLFAEGLAGATRNVFEDPGLFLLVFGLTALSAGFHEFGHAAACRYGGATPGAMGAGLYLVWPAFYTEVGDSYRLGRTARVRVDVGGLYFNAIFAVAVFGVWLTTDWQALLLVIAAQVVQMIRQLAPLVRFDGYHILADLTGVPDLYAHIKPTLLSLLPTRWRTPSALTWWARTIVAAWVLFVVPILVLTVILMVVSLPRVIATAWAGLGEHWQSARDDFATADWASGLVDVIGIFAVVLPALGVTYLLFRTVRRYGSKVRTWSAGNRRRRAVVILSSALLLVGLAWAWWPDDSYRPIERYEQGTLLDVAPVADVSQQSPADDTSTRLKDGDLEAAQSIWAGHGKPPTKEQPQLAVVLSPQPGQTTSSGDPAPTWIFPFDPPEAPGEGDNQALAVNYTDGGTTYDVAFALVWADDDSVLNTNAAYAYASCTRCTTVAVAFQVVLVVGQADVVVPQNLAGAVNYNCVQCTTYALAQQLVLTIDGPLDDATMAQLDDLWADMQQFAQSIDDIPLDEVRAALLDYEQQMAVIVQDASATSNDGAGTPTTEASPTPEESTSSEPSGDATPSPDVSNHSTSSEPTASESESSSPSPSTSATATP